MSPLSLKESPLGLLRQLQVLPDGTGADFVLERTAIRLDSAQFFEFIEMVLDLGGKPSRIGAIENIEARIRSVVLSPPPPLLPNAMTKLVGILTGMKLEIRRSNVLVGRGTSLGAIFRPPSAQFLHSLLEDLSAFLRRSRGGGLYVAVMIAIRLLQIHPYTEGNGRLARFVFWLEASRYVSPSIATSLAREFFLVSKYEMVQASVVQATTNSWQEVLSLFCLCGARLPPLQQPVPYGRLVLLSS